ncbi:Polysaccharide biosynthesis protein [Enhydrobacter sp. AX1]|nr:O-antigen translocase [Enhydrobacter sp. AX1]VXB17808.1 Polysaccharide biosynthesis protein [Enhydrobacter sp. AX1]
MDLLKTSVLNGIAVLVKTATMFILNKILAVYVGPSGYAAIGQFQNFIQMVTSFAGGSINTAVVKYTAEYGDNPTEQRKIWQNAGTIILALSIIFSLLIIVFQKPLSLYIFHSTEYRSVFIWFGIFLIFFNFNALFLAILNGKKEILKLVIANIAGSVFSLVITGFLAYQYHILGALIALSIYQSIAFFITLILCVKSDWFKFEFLFGQIDKVIAAKFGHYALMALVSAVCVPLSQIVIRSLLTKEFGASYAGYWEAMTRLSGAYLMLVTTTLGVYYLPKLSELKTFHEIKHEVYIGYKFIFPLALMGGLAVYLLRDWIIKLLFTESFMPMRELFLWQIIGDILKIGSWILAYLMLGKAMTKLFIITEIAFSISLVSFTYLCTHFIGFQGSTVAYMLNYALYWLVMSILIFQNIER